MTDSNPTALQWWKSGGEPIEGRFFPGLFRLEVSAESEEARLLQWEVLVEAASSEPLQLEAEGAGDGFSAQVTIEKGGGSAYVARVERAEAEPPVPAELAEAEARVVEAPRPAATSTRDNGSGIDSPEAGGLSSPWSALETAPHMGFFSLDFSSHTYRYSAAWKRMLGYAEYELPNRHETLIKLIHPEDSAATPDQSVRGIPGTQSPFSLEFRMRHRSGRYVWVQSVGVQEFGAAGDLERVSGFHLDIQERKEIEEESLQNEERFLALLQRGNLVFFDLDLRNRRAFFSPAWQEILGFAEGDLAEMPETFRRLLDSKTAGADDLVRIFTDSESGRSSFSRELRMKRKDGEFVNLHTRIVRLTNRRNELIRVIGFQAAPGSGNRQWSGSACPESLFGALQAVNEAVVLTDAHSKVIFINATAARLTGLTADQATGLALTEALHLLRAADEAPADNLADEVLATGTPIDFSRDFLLANPGGEPTPVVLSCEPLRDGDERILGAALIFRDPAEMSLTPEELVKSNRMESLGLLAGGVAHDFNNLLTTIVGGVSLARETREWAPLDNSEKAALAAKNLTRQLLTFARGKSSGRKVVAVANLVRDCVRLASAGSRTKPELALPADLHPAAVDPPRMAQVFQNLIINAIQAMGERGGQLTVSGENLKLSETQVDGLPGGDFLRISVKDTGGGIPREHLAHIFQPFFTTKKTGTGLGLSTVHSIVRDHEGQITVTSEVGVGTTFHVYLPKNAQPVEVETRRAPSLKFGTGRILFMDDDEEIAALAEGMLQRLDYQFDVARNGEEATALYRRYLDVKRPYDAVILDLTIVGGMGGEETLAELLKLDPDVRAIVSSGYSTDETQDYYLNKGFAGVLSKPYRSEEMGKVLRKVLGLD